MQPVTSRLWMNFWETVVQPTVMSITTSVMHEIVIGQDPIGQQRPHTSHKLHRQI